MKKISLILLMSMASSMALADFNSDCKFAYREASVQLMEKISDFQQSRINDKQLSAEKIKIEAVLKTIRSACYFGEDAANKDCVTAYKGIYAEIDSKVNAIAVAVGNQSTVDQSLLNTLVLKSKIKFQDLRCNYDN